jgi:hypothetical protein
MNWKTLTALLLVLPIYWWLVCTVPPFGAVALTMHLAEKGEHCSSFCQHVSSIIEAPREFIVCNVSDDELVPACQLITWLSIPHAARDRPPPLFSSPSHRFRPPPTLTLA